MSGGVSVNLLNRDVYWGVIKAYLAEGIDISLLFDKLFTNNLYGEVLANGISSFLGCVFFQVTAFCSIFCAGLNKSITSSTDKPTTAYEFGFGGGVSAGLGYSDTLIKNAKP